jgi:hypothetical protein
LKSLNKVSAELAETKTKITALMILQAWGEGGREGGREGARAGGKED